jgi:hypothetical protein
VGSLQAQQQQQQHGVNITGVLLMSRSQESHLLVDAAAQLPQRAMHV